MLVAFPNNLQPFNLQFLQNNFLSRKADLSGSKLSAFKVLGHAI